LDGLATRTFRLSMTGATVMLVPAVYLLLTGRGDVSVSGSYVAFSTAIVIWGWIEMSFLMGFITGPRKSGCGAHCGGFEHFFHATEAIIYNELATLLATAGILAATWHAPNRMALWTFLVLWTMRLSAKLNLFLGIRNLGEKFLPAHLQYLTCFFRRRPMNFLFPVSISASTAVTGMLVQRFLASSDPFQCVSYALLTSLLGLGVIEHWFMVLPLPSEKLWAWAMQSNRDKSLNAGKMNNGGALSIQPPRCD
jgi:putative photosynthetic complex assembly protein 2